MASLEFGVAIDTISKRIKAAGLMAGEDSRFSTKQIAIAVYGDLERERIRLTAAEADSQERENLIELGKLIDVDEFKRDFATVYVEIVRQIRTSSLSESEQDNLLTSLTKVHHP